MPSIATLKAIGGLGGATEDLRKILAQRLAEQSQRDLVAEREASDERERLEREALAQYRKDQQDLEERKFEETQTENRGQANERGLRLMGMETEMARKAEQVRERERLLADPTTPDRQKQWIRLAGQGQPPATLLDDPDAAFKAWERERQAELGYDKDLALYQSKLKPGPSPDTPPKPSDAEQALPPELSGFLNDLTAVAPNLQVARRAIIKNRPAIQKRFPTAKFNVIDEALQQFYGGAIQSGARKGVGEAPTRPRNPFASYTPDPDWTLPEGPVVTDPGAGTGGTVTPPAVDPVYDAYLKSLKQQFPK